MKNPRTFYLAVSLVVFATLALLAGAPRAEERTTGSEAPLVALAGPDSHIAAQSYHRIRDREAWVDLWLRHAGLPREKHSDYYNPARIPAVDFTRAEVIAVFQGAGFNSAGVDFVEALDVGGEHHLRFDDRSYQTKNGTDACTAYAFFIVTRTDEPVVLIENVQGTIGGPPVWKERARLD